MIRTTLPSECMQSRICTTRLFHLPPVARLDVAVLNGHGRRDAPFFLRAEARPIILDHPPLLPRAQSCVRVAEVDGRNTLDLDGTAFVGCGMGTRPSLDAAI